VTSAQQKIADLHVAAQKALKNGMLRDVHRHCLSILEIDPTFADAWFLCGIIAAHNGQIAKAISILERSIELDADKCEYRAELSKHLLALDLPERALQQAEIALTLQPQALPTLNTLGTVFSHSGEHEKALRCFETANELLQARPRGADGLTPEWVANLYFNQAASLQFAGRLADAEEAYEKSIQLEPTMFKAHSALSTLRRQSLQDNHLKRLNALRSEIKSTRDQLHLGHAIAKELEDLEQYRDSFSSLEWAKQAHAEVVGYRAEDDAQYFKGLMALFDRELLQQNSLGNNNNEPIFIVGMPRTGTTLVEQIVSCHSQVYAAGELQNFPLQVTRATGAEPRDLLDLTTLQQSLGVDLDNLGAGYINSTRPRTGHTQRFIDKLPLNFLLLGLIRLALPNAKLVCLRRDPMDTCLSNFRQLFAIDFKPYHYNYNLLDCGRYFVLFDQLMRHWHAAMPGAIHEVAYEALVADPEQVTRDLLDYCGLPWEDQCLDFHLSKSSVATPSAMQVKQQIYTGSVDRWRRYGDVLHPLHQLLNAAGLYRSA
jgi:Tfp pilus assembly protein PilF